MIWRRFAVVLVRVGARYPMVAPYLRPLWRFVWRRIEQGRR